MIQPQRAAVTPRVIWPETGDAVPIDEVFHRMDRQPAGAIEIVGSSGSGKTTALRHLAAEAPKDRDIAWLDDAMPGEIKSQKSERWVVYTSSAPIRPIATFSFQLAGWGPDERIEYLLATHPERCQSVIVRLSETADRATINDSPTLWRLVLDEMAEHDSICSVEDAVWRRIMGAFPRGRARRYVEEYCITRFVPDHSHAQRAMQWMSKRDVAEEQRLLAVPRVQTLLAADCIVRWLEGARRSPFSRGGLRSLSGRARRSEAPPWVLPIVLVERIVESVKDSPRAIRRLRKILTDDDSHLHSMAASVLHASVSGWRPDRESRPCLDGGYFRGAAWPDIDLREMELNGADLSGSDLARARLDEAQACSTRFNRASLQDASLVRITAKGADFSRTDLRRSNLEAADLANARLCQARVDGANLEKVKLYASDLREASFVGANLRQAKLCDATIDGTNFTSAEFDGADLHGLDLRGAVVGEACFFSANLRETNFEGMHLARVNFVAAKLTCALFSGSIMPGGKLRFADLRGAGLADVQWENVDLHNADLRGATFHLGTTRSGLIDSPLASEGTRTGFYTDEFDEQSYQAPEEIRKANLRGADLRGAKIDGVDFYLVDVRGAKYDLGQLVHLRQCGAILDDRR